MYHGHDWKNMSQAMSQNFDFKHEAEEKTKAAEATAKFERERAENKEIGSGGWLYGASNSSNSLNVTVPSRFMPPVHWMRPSEENPSMMTEHPNHDAFYNNRSEWPEVTKSEGDWPAAPKPEVKSCSHSTSRSPSRSHSTKTEGQQPHRSSPSPNADRKLNTSDVKNIEHFQGKSEDSEKTETDILNKTEDSEVDEEPAKVEDCAPSGWLYRATWALQEDLSIEYAIRLGDSSQPDSVPDVDDVFVFVDQAAKLLTTCNGARVKPPNIKTIWTVSLDGENGKDLDLCPLTEFVYHAALKASGKKFQKVFDGILKEIVRALFASRIEPGNASGVVKYSEKSIKVKNFHEGRKPKSVKYAEDDNEDGGNWDDMTNMLNQDLAAQLLKEEIKMEPGEDRDSDSDGDQEQEELMRELRELQDDDYDEPKVKKTGKKRKRAVKPDFDDEGNEIKKKKKKAVKAEPGESKPKPKDKSKREFLCDVCEYSTTTKKYLLLHMRYHDESCRLKCPHCDFNTFQTQRMKGHINSVHLGIPFKCDKCDYSDFSEVKVRFHKKAIHKGEIYQCEQCSYTTIYPNSLKTHQAAQHPTEEDRHACPACDYVTTSAINLKNHKESAHSNITYTCDQCGKNFRSKQTLHGHVKTVHSASAEYVCDMCDYSTNHRMSFKNHVQVKHEGKPLECKDPNCSFTANNQSSISDHYNVVHLKKTYNCDICQFMGQTRKELARHKNKHKQDILAGVAGVARNMAARNMAAYHH